MLILGFAAVLHVATLHAHSLHSNCSEGRGAATPVPRTRGSTGKIARWSAALQLSPAGVDEGPLFEGDIILREDEHLTGVRNLVTGPDNLWPDGVLYYDYSPEFGEAQVAEVEAAVRDLQAHTCVQIVRRTTQPHYVRLRNVDFGCASYVGYEPETPVADLFLSYPGCFGNKGIIQHEFLHALGLWHEHSRPDRDHHVTIIWQNIVPGRESNFQARPYEEEEFNGIPYDYDSVMHYRASAFSRDDVSPTIVPRDAAAFSRIGQRHRYSFYDLVKLNRLYKCGGSYTWDKALQS